MPQSMLALFNLGGGEIILILLLLLILMAPLVVIAGVIFLVIWANKRKQGIQSASMPPRIPHANT